MPQEDATDEPADPAGPASDRVRLRRGVARGVYDRAAMLAVLDAGMVAHLGVVTDDGPIVLPMAYARTDDRLYVHGSVANAMLRAAVGHDVCVTVTVLDALVVARSPFHNSMHYRGVVVRGVARRVTDEQEHLDALRRITDHVVPTWDTGRAPTTAEIRKTMVLAIPLVEMSAKIRDGGPADEPEDLQGPHWGGHIPLHTCWGAPIPARDLRAGIGVPAAVAAMEGRSVR
jgi:nitroimidazol reductase NimA-like FMN-containing flavoprotein (pyridoxamine 5'-phosphate oxidase superfamily)